MSFPSSGSGYPQQGGTPQQPQSPSSGGFPQQQPPPPGTGGFGQQGGTSVATLNVAVFLALATTVLGLVNYFIGFSEEFGQIGLADMPIQFLLIGGLLGALRVLPQGRKVLPFAAVASVLGGLYAILLMVRVPEEADTPGVFTVLLILGILQMLVAVVGVLFDFNVFKLPTPQQHQAPYPQQYAQPAQQQQGQYMQPTQYGPPVTPPPGQGTETSQASQPTLYASQQGQFYQQQAPETGQQNQDTSRNPGEQQT